MKGFRGAQDPEAAHASASRGRELFRRLGDRRALALERTAVGARLACGQLAEALAEAEAAWRLCQVDRCDLDEALALVVLAEVHRHRDAWAEEARCARRAAELFAGRDRRNEAAALHTAARAELSRGGSQEALPLAQKAQEIFRELRERQREAGARL